MALNARNRIAAVGTAAEALKRTLQLVLAWAILAVILSGPWAVAAAFGAFDGLGAYGGFDMAGDVGQQLGGLPLAPMVLLLVGGFFMVVIFGIFWHRYVLLGAGEALKFGFAELNAMVWQSSGRGLLVLVLSLALFALALLAISLADGRIDVAGGVLSGLTDNVPRVVILPSAVLLAVALPLVLTVRLCLVFPAIALGEPLTFGESWAATKGSASKLLVTILVAGPSLAVLVCAIGVGVSRTLGIDILNLARLASVDHPWMVVLALGPVSFLAVAVSFAIVAIAYRDLDRAGTAVEVAGDTQLAH